MVAASWAEAFAAIAAKLSQTPADRIGAVAGSLADAESVLALKDLMAAYRSTNLDCREDGAAIDGSRADFYRFNTTIAGIEEADALLIIGADPRKEAPVLNARIRKRWAQGRFPVGVIGPAGIDLTYSVQHLGEGPAVLSALLDGSHPFAATLKAAQKPMLILGRGAIARADGAAVLASAWRLAAEAGMLKPDWHGFNLLHQFGGQVGALELGFLPGQGGKDLSAMLSGGVDALWLLNADGFDPARIPASTFVIYQGHHGDAMAARADVLLPGAAYTEKDATWVNTEGRAQRSYRAIHPPGEAREDWRIIRAFSEGVGKTLPYNDLDALRARLASVSPAFARIGEVTALGCADMAGPQAAMAMEAAPFRLPIMDYHRADVISRASDVMAECAAVYGPQQALAAE
jgi:NADH-quinone oxidoreductase subunit G